MFLAGSLCFSPPGRKLSSNGLMQTSQTSIQTISYRTRSGGGRMVRWCWVNFQCWGALLILIIVGQGPSALTVHVAACGVVWTFLLASISSLSFLPLSGRRPDIDRNTVSKGR